jgi:amino acid transporter
MILLFTSANQVNFLVSSEFSVPTLFSQCMSQQGALTLSKILAINFFFSGLASETVTVRIGYALARDNGMPFSSLLKVVFL